MTAAAPLDSTSQAASNDVANAAAVSAPRRILYCHCAHSRVVPKDVKNAMLAGLADSGVAFDAVPDLCELAARRDPSLERLAKTTPTDEDGTPALEIVACYPRAVRWLFHAADAPLPEHGVRIHNMRADSAETLLPVVVDGTPVAAESETDTPETASAETDTTKESPA